MPRLDITATQNSKYYDTGIAFGNTLLNNENEQNEQNEEYHNDLPASSSPTAMTPTSSSAPNATMTNIGTIKIFEERIPNRSMNFTDEPNPSEVRKLLDAIAKQSKTINKLDARNRAKSQVIAQAFDRCLSNVESDAKSDESYRYEQMKLQDEYDAKLQAKRRQQLESSQELHNVLQSQVEAGHNKKQLEQLDQRNAKIQCILPQPDDHYAELQARKQKHTKLLLDQIDNHVKEREDEKYQRIMKEKAFLSQIAEENDLSLLISRSRHLERQKELLQAWEQDGHIRNLKKLQTLGTNLIQDYIDVNLVETRANSSRGGGSRGTGGGGSGAGGALTPSLGKSFMKSIGYDPRTGKK